MSENEFEILATDPRKTSTGDLFNETDRILRHKNTGAIIHEEFEKTRERRRSILETAASVARIQWLEHEDLARVLDAVGQFGDSELRSRDPWA